MWSHPRQSITYTEKNTIQKDQDFNQQLLINLFSPTCPFLRYLQEIKPDNVRDVTLSRPCLCPPGELYCLSLIGWLEKHHRLCLSNSPPAPASLQHIVSCLLFKRALCLPALLLTQVQGCTKLTSPSLLPPTAPPSSLLPSPFVLSPLSQFACSSAPLTWLLTWPPSSPLSWLFCYGLVQFFFLLLPL